jgi:hypothetical protein
MINHRGRRGHRERLRELAQVSGRLVELARVQSVSGKVLNISPVPRKVADPILKSLRRKLEKGGDRQAVRGVFGVSRPQTAAMPVFNHTTGAHAWAKVWNPVTPKLVDIDGKKSILHYRGADTVDSLRTPRHDAFVLSGEYSKGLASEGFPEKIRQKYSKSAKSRVKLKRAGIDNEGPMRSHISQNTGDAISTSVNPAVSREYLTGQEPVLGVYATSLNDLIRNQQKKSGASIVNNAFPFEQEITQVHGDNLLKIRPYKLAGQGYTRQSLTAPQ